MADDVTTPPEQQDPLKNLKSEFDRKLGNADARLAELQRSNELLMSKLNSIAPTAAAAKSENLSDILYADPERYARIVEERAEARAMDKMNRQQEKMGKVNNTINALAQEFPELSDGNHQLTKRAVEIYSSLSDEERNSSMSYKMAVREAADELSIKPKSKRPVDDEPSFGSSGSRGASRRAAKLDGSTEEFASILGLDTSDSKVRERLLAKQNRNWSQYQPVRKGK